MQLGQTRSTNQKKTMASTGEEDVQKQTEMPIPSSSAPTQQGATDTNPVENKNEEEPNLKDPSSNNIISATSAAATPTVDDSSIGLAAAALTETGEASPSPSSPAEQPTTTTTATAAQAPSTRNDATVAETLQAIEQLSSVFGFDWEVAQQAVDEVGPDIKVAYNYILDQNMGVDQGGPIVPIEDCPHVSMHVRIQPPDLPSPSSCCDYYATNSTNDGGAKSDIKDGLCPPGENWVCLHCGAVRCSRYVNSHSMVHYDETKARDEEGDGAGHCIVASLGDLSVWCHECNAYLRHPRLDPLIEKLEQLKFGDEGENTDTVGNQDICRPADIDASDEDPSDSSSDDGRGIPFGYAEEDIGPLDYPFGSLPENMKGVADFIMSENCKSIVILAGAGMSVVSGIPDFRSAGGLYDTLRPELLTASETERELFASDPTAALSQPIFVQNPLPCLELMRPFMLGTRAETWKATLAHRFVELLHAKTGKLTRLYTQNIDGLEGQCHQLPRDKVIAVHGSMDQADCAMCGSETDYDVFCDAVQRQIKDITKEDTTAPSESKAIACNFCGYNTVKPSIVLFRSNLPEEFFRRVPEDIPECDCLIVIGTSLTVAPANTLVFRVPPDALRVFVNRDRVGRHLGVMYGEEYGSPSTRDYFALGEIDKKFLDLMCELGWLDDLETLIDDLPEASAEMLRERLESRNDGANIADTTKERDNDVVKEQEGIVEESKAEGADAQDGMVAENEKDPDTQDMMIANKGVNTSGQDTALASEKKEDADSKNPAVAEKDVF